MSHIHRAVGMLSFRVHMYWLSLLQARSPENSLKELRFRKISTSDCSFLDCVWLQKKKLTDSLFWVRLVHERFLKRKCYW